MDTAGRSAIVAAMAEPKREGAPSSLVGALDAYEVRGVGPDGNVQVEGVDGLRDARLAVAGGYRPAPGDRVLVGRGTAGELYVVGVLRALRDAEILARAADGSTVRERTDGDRVLLSVHAPDGRLLVEHCAAEGRMTIHAHSGLDVQAGSGLLALRSEREVQIEGRAGVRITSDRRVIVESPAGETTSELVLEPRGAVLRANEITAEATDLNLQAADTLRMAGRLVATTAGRIFQRTEELEVQARELVERVRDSYREVEELAQTRAGQIRLVAAQSFRALAKRAQINAEEDVKIRGETIYLD